MEFLSDAWLAALDATAAAMPADDARSGLDLVIEFIVTDVRSYRFTFTDGALRVSGSTDAMPEADIRMSGDLPTSAAVASGNRSALDAFICGDLMLGGDTRLLLEHRAALETVGDLFASVKATTTFS